ncbi:MAG: exodeoxyribonuclease VII small subunit [Pseudomonadota bacterium]|nr:exodeoxyribonuclease VII small subunit [Pseudomonadota bacterium]
MPKPVENTANSASEPSFEAALKELEAIVRKLESGSGDLEASINDYVRGTELKAFCQEKLKAARLKVESILKTADGNLALKPFEENT